MMYHRIATASLVALFGSLAFSSVHGQELNRPPDGFIALFNGRDIDGWTGTRTRDPREIKALPPDERAAWDAEMEQGIRRHWHVEDGVLVNDGEGPYLATTDEYGDVEMWIDWLIQPGGDSGVYLRDAPQVQIWDYRDPDLQRHGAGKGSGGLWNNQHHERFPTERADRPVGQWNRMFIRMVGSYVSVELNAKLVVDNVVMENFYDRSIPIFKRGSISLQTHGGETRFRNIFLREIPYEEANRALGEMRGGEDRFEPLFNGKDLTGWIGAVDDYEIVDGTIRCKPGRRGNLLAAEMYDNFVARLEFKLPPGGNNGLAIRSPSADARASTEGMEIQVLDDTAEQYANLKDFQYHGSLYGLAPATRGYLRPVGQWNYQEVIVDRDHIEVHLNGYEILNVNLDEVRQQPLDGRKRPGAYRSSGYFGFLGHNDPVAFRNIRIKRLP